MLLDSSSGQGSGLIGNSIDEVRSDRVLGAIDPDSIVARGAGLAIRGSDGPGSNEDQLVDIVTRREVEEPERVPPREVPTELIVEGGVEGGVPGGVEGGVVGGVPGGVEGGVVGGVPGGVAGGVEGGVEGGVPGGVAGGVVAPKLDPDAPPPPDPHGGAFDLAEALAGDPSLAPDRPGKLAAVIRTSRGTMRCELFDDRAPRTVANFIGLARGVRAWLDPATNTWERRPLYAGTPLHRVIDGFMIQGGDPEGSGRGGPGYTFADEIDPTLGYDAPGVLAMANRGPDTNGSQFFVTVAPTPHLQGRSTIFGQCEPTLPLRIAKVPVDDRDRPKREVRIESITIVRK
ncbi:MAG: peptidylprolyl isomerase [Myxococcales bacterium]|nr:peptidylprolyl isomerase [Myxococcales bacterium]